MLIKDYSDEFKAVGIPKREQPITRVTIHAAECNTNSATEMKDWFISRIKNNHPSSCNYFIDCSGNIALFVPEEYRAWTSSSSFNDQRAITIECATISKAPYTLYSKTQKALEELLVDICKRYGKTDIVLVSKEEAQREDSDDGKMHVTYHNYFADTSCPGLDITKKMQSILEAVRLHIKPVYAVQLGAYYSKSNA